MENYDNLDGNSELKLSVNKYNQRALRLNGMIKDKVNESLIADIETILGPNLEEAGISMEELLESVEAEQQQKESSRVENEDNSKIHNSLDDELELDE